MKRTLPIALTLLTLVSPASATSDGCAEVLPAPDGFVELKDAPGARFATIMRLLPGEKLWVDTARCTTLDEGQVCDDRAEWWHVTSVPRLDDQEGKRSAEPIFTRGWLPSRAIKTFDCEE